MQRVVATAAQTGFQCFRTSRLQPTSERSCVVQEAGPVNNLQDPLLGVDVGPEGELFNPFAWIVCALPR